MDACVQENAFKRFSPRDYLDEYYGSIGPENDALLSFYVDTYKQLDNSPLMLEFGGGPTIYQLIAAATRVREIHFADLLDCNLGEVGLWKCASPLAFEWKHFVRRTLEIEGYQAVTDANIEERVALLRFKLTQLLRCDAFMADPLGPHHRAHYDLVSVNFVPESITASRVNWMRAVANILSLLKPSGLLLMTALTNASYWLVKDEVFPAVSIDETDIEQLLRNLGCSEIVLHSIPAEVADEDSGRYKGYQGATFVRARL